MSGEFAKVNPNVEKVLYLPAADRVNKQIAYLNEMMKRMRPADSAEFMASSVAAIAYMILETNDDETVKRIFSMLVDEAYSQRRDVALLKEADRNNPQ